MSPVRSRRQACAVGTYRCEDGRMPYVLLLHGHMGAPPPHCQSWLAHELAETGCVVDVPQLSEPDRPRLDVWLAELRHQLEAAPRTEERVVLAHSCGAALWLHHAAQVAD